MALLSDIVVAVVAALHVAFLVLEMFLWTRPFGRKAFGLTADAARSSATLAANQGLYNGFLAAGLVWGVAANLTDVKVFFLSCVIIAGLYGGISAKRSILWVQALPAVIALALVLMTRS